MGKPIKVAFLADTADLRSSLDKAETSLKGAAETAERSGDKIKASLDSAAEGSDQVASASSQAAGGIGDIAGALEATGFISEGTAQSLETASAAIMGVTGAADLMNLATEKIPGLQKVATVATKGLAAAKRALGVAIRFAMGPVGLIIAGIMLLTGLFVLLYKRNETFRKIVDTAWAAIKKAIGNTAEWLKAKVPPIFEKIWAVIKNVPIVWVIRNFDQILGYVKGLPGKIKAGAAGMWDGVKDSFRSMLNAIIGWWNSLDLKINIPDWVPKIGGRSADLVPDVPYLAAGGIVTGPTLAMIGEAGPEAVIPLDGRHGLGVTQHITAHVVVPRGADRLAVGRELVAALEEYRRAGGRSPVLGGV